MGPVVIVEPICRVGLSFREESDTTRASSSPWSNPTKPWSPCLRTRGASGSLHRPLRRRGTGPRSGPARACRVLEQTPCDGRPRPRSPCAPRCAPFGPRRRSARPGPAELTHLERAGARSLTRREPGPPHPRNGELPPAALGRLLPGQCDRSGGSPARSGAEPRRLFPAPTRALRAHTNDRRDARTFASDSGQLPHSPREVPPPRRLHGGHLARCLTTPFDSRANP